MAIEITIPRLGWNMDEGTFVGWLKQDGDAIKAGDSLFTLEGEKATEDIECLDSGILRIPLNAPQPGDKIAVGTVIGYLVKAGEDLPYERERKKEAIPLVSAASPAVRRLAREKGIELGHVAATGRAGRVTAEDVERSASTPPRTIPAKASRKPAVSPRARRAARELGIDCASIVGTGRTGRVRERDVWAAAKQTGPGTNYSLRRSAQTVPVSAIRRTVAERLLASVRSTAPVTLTTTTDATNLVNLREQFKATADLVPSYTDFLVKLSAAALSQHPLLNASWAGDEIAISQVIHVGIAVDTEAGLLVPVIHDVANLSLRQVAERSRDLAERARQRKLKAEEMQGGTFTITNLGAFGIDAFTPIINYPQCAILGVGRIERQPVVIGEEITVREQIALSLTFDHRIVDGAPAARFLQTLCRLIENPGPCLMT